MHGLIYNDDGSMDLSVPSGAVGVHLDPTGVASFPQGGSTSSSPAPSTGLPIGYRFDYVERTPNGVYNVPVGTDGNGGAFPWIQGNPVTYDGATEICVEAYIAAIEADYNSAIIVNLYEGTTDLGAIIDQATGQNSSNGTRGGKTGLGRRYFTPTAGSHTYQLRIWAVSGTTNNVYSRAGGGVGGSSSYMPAYLRITKAS